MATPTVLVITAEIVVDDGNAPDSVLDDIARMVHQNLWGTIVPVLGIKAQRNRAKAVQAHIHESTESDSCRKCMETAMNERNSDSV